MAKRKRTKGERNDLQTTTQKTKDRATRRPLSFSRSVISVCSTGDSCMLLLSGTNIILHENLAELNGITYLNYIYRTLSAFAMNSYAPITY